MYYVHTLLAQLWEEISRPNRLRQNVVKILHLTPWLRMIQKNTQMFCAPNHIAKIQVTTR